MKHRSLLLFFCIALAQAGCRDRQDAPRQYREIGAAPLAPAASAPAADAPPPAAFAWDSPEGWEESRGSGMRAATFKLSTPRGDGLCTIVVLAGEAGGMEANVRRWLEQIEVQVEGESLTAFLEDLPDIPTRAGGPAQLVDLRGFIKDGAPETPAMLAAVWSRPERTVFIKFSGPLGLLEAEQASFLALVGSLR